MAEVREERNVWALRKMQDVGHLEHTFYATEVTVISTGHLS
jgi:hypothetical protein